MEQDYRLIDVFFFFGEKIEDYFKTPNSKRSFPSKLFLLLTQRRKRVHNHDVLIVLKGIGGKELRRKKKVAPKSS